MTWCGEERKKRSVCDFYMALHRVYMDGGFCRFRGRLLYIRGGWSGIRRGIGMRWGNSDLFGACNAGIRVHAGGEEWMIIAARAVFLGALSRFIYLKKLQIAVICVYLRKNTRL